MSEHEQGSAHQKGQTAEERGQTGTQGQHQGGAVNEKDHGSAQKQDRSAKNAPNQEQTGSENRAPNERNRAETNGQAEHNVQENRGERNAAERENLNRGGQGQYRGRETEFDGGGRNEAARRARGERNRFASISREQRTRIHGILVHDTAIHRYHRTDVDFPVEVGARIPATFEFYDPPAQLVQIDPAFRGFKIVVLDDVILVVDPETREIVDLIRV